MSYIFLTTSNMLYRIWQGFGIEVQVKFEDKSEPKTVETTQQQNHHYKSQQQYSRAKDCALTNIDVTSKLIIMLLDRSIVVINVLAFGFDDCWFDPTVCYHFFFSLSFSKRFLPDYWNNRHSQSLKAYKKTVCTTG